MAQSDPDDNTTNGFPDFFHIVPIERGPDRKKWKAPQTKGWNDDAVASQYPSTLYDGFNGGICHKQSNTCAIDVDNLKRARELFTARGLDLNRLLMTGCQISSGRDNRSKLLYKLPAEVIMLGAYPRLRQIAESSGMVMEFRCVYGTGKTCQDVAPGSIHPDNGQHYTWINPNPEIPVIPAELLQWWYELIPKNKAADSGSWAGTPDTPDERAKVTRALRGLSPDISYPDWRSVGVAIHDTGWLDAFELWDDWSSHGMEYDFDLCVDKWDDMSAGGGINITWLYALAYQHDKNWDRASAQEMFDAVDAQPATIDEATGQVVQNLHSIVSSVTKESDANYLEWVCQHIAYQEPNRLAQGDWMRLTADLSRYNQTELGAMLTSARRELTRQRNHGGAVLEFPHLNDSDNPLPTRANAELVATTYGFEFKFNLMSRRVETIRDLSHVPADVRELSHLTDFEDLCMQHRLDDKRVQKHRDRIAFEKSYHPFVDYLEAEKVLGGAWKQGDTDWVSRLSASLVCSQEYRDLRTMLLTRWLVSVVAAAHMKDEDDYEPWEDKPRAPRGVLVLQGAQNIGKTSWFNTITPDGMYKEGLQINQGDMNHMKTATNRLIVEIGEADHVTQGRMANYMKTIIGRSVDEVRLAFQKEEVRMVRRNVFCATVNPAEFLSDDQNTRWWTITVTSIDFKQLELTDIKRMWQQVYTLWRSGEPYHLTLEEMDLLNDSNEKFRAMSFFEAWLLDTYDFDEMKGQDDSTNWHTTKEILLKYHTTPDVSATQVKEILLRLTGRQNLKVRLNRGQGRYWHTPISIEAAPLP